MAGFQVAAEGIVIWKSSGGHRNTNRLAMYGKSISDGSAFRVRHPIKCGVDGKRQSFGVFDGSRANPIYDMNDAWHGKRYSKQSQSYSKSRGGHSHERLRAKAADRAVLGTTGSGSI